MKFNVQVLRALEELYITDNDRYVKQYLLKSGSLKFKTEYEEITDDILVEHLKGDKMAVCIFGDKKLRDSEGVAIEDYLINFMTFDVDSKEDAEADVFRVLGFLKEDGLTDEDIHISISGSKGYHITVFFNKSVPYKRVELYYEVMIDEIDRSGKSIELRPKSTLALKMPLGVHQSTGKRCWFVNNTTLEPIEDYEYITRIKKADPVEVFSRRFGEDIIALTDEDFGILKDAFSDVNLDSEEEDEIEVEERFRKCEEILGEYVLPGPGTRHDAVLDLGQYFKMKGNSQKEAEGIINGLIYNTMEEYPERVDTPRKQIALKTRSQLNSVYRLNYSFRSGKNEVKIYKSEIDVLLGIKSWGVKKTYLSMLIHNKRHSIVGAEFFMSYGQMSKMGCGNNRGRTIKKVKKLEELGLLKTVIGLKERKLEIIKEGLRQSVISGNSFEYDKGSLTKKLIEGRKANVYKMKRFHGEDEDSILVVGGSEISLESIILDFYDIDEIKKIKKERDTITRTELDRIKTASEKMEESDEL